MHVSLYYNHRPKRVKDWSQANIISFMYEVEKKGKYFSITTTPIQLKYRPWVGYGVVQYCSVGSMEIVETIASVEYFPTKVVGVLSKQYSPIIVDLIVYCYFSFMLVVVIHVFVRGVCLLFSEPIWQRCTVTGSHILIEKSILKYLHVPKTRHWTLRHRMSILIRLSSIANNNKLNPWNTYHLFTEKMVLQLKIILGS